MVDYMHCTYLIFIPRGMFTCFILNQYIHLPSLYLFISVQYVCYNVEGTVMMIRNKIPVLILHINTKAIAVHNDTTDNMQYVCVLVYVHITRY